MLVIPGCSENSYLVTALKGGAFMPDYESSMPAIGNRTAEEGERNLRERLARRTAVGATGWIE